MKLRNGKTTGSDNWELLKEKAYLESKQKKDALVQKIKEGLAAGELVPAENIPERIQSVHNVFTVISDNIDYLVSFDFSFSSKFTTAVYNKTYEIANAIFPSIDTYIAENRIVDNRLYYKMAQETYFLLLKVRQDIEKHCPELKPKYKNDYSGCDCSTCLDD